MAPADTCAQQHAGDDSIAHTGPRIIWIGSGLMEFIPVTDGHLYGRARINGVCWREFFRQVRPKLPAHIRTTKGLRKKITSSISYGSPTPKCTFFFDTDEGGRQQLGSFFILAEGGAQQ
jgi:hypothetical protein